MDATQSWYCVSYYEQARPGDYNVDTPGVGQSYGLVVTFPGIDGRWRLLELEIKKDHQTSKWFGLWHLLFGYFLFTWLNFVSIYF
jgi:hypothetical protein